MTDTLALCREKLTALPAGAAVLEAGTFRWHDDPTHHADWLPGGVVHVRTDFRAGSDVDVAADLHDLAPFTGDTFDAFLALAVWEHVERPLLANAAVLRILKPGGWCFIQTHFAFPEHGYPDDYHRWTTAGLAADFRHSGFELLGCDYTEPCTIVPPAHVQPWNTAAPAWLNVSIIAQKPARVEQ